MNSTHKSFPRKLALRGLLLTPNILVSQSPLAQDVRAKINDDNPAPHLHNTEDQADLLASSRLVLTILQEENACSTWIRHFDPEAVSTFLSLNYYVEKNGPQHVIREKGRRVPAAIGSSTDLTSPERYKLLDPAQS